MGTFNYLMAQALLIFNAKLRKENTAKRVGGLFRDILNFMQNAILGMILKGVLANEMAIKSIVNPVKGDTYKAADTNSYWCYDGSLWNNIGEVIPSDVKYVVDHIKVMQNDEFIFAITAGDGVLLWGIRYDFSIFEITVPGRTAKALNNRVSYSDVTLELDDSLNPISNIAIQKLMDSLNNSLAPLLKTFSFTEKDYLMTMEDTQRHVLATVDMDGTFYFRKLKLPKEVWTEIDNHIKDLK